MNWTLSSILATSKEALFDMCLSSISSENNNEISDITPTTSAPRYIPHRSDLGTKGSEETRPRQAIRARDEGWKVVGT